MDRHELVFPTRMHKAKNSKLNLQGKLSLEKNHKDSAQDKFNSDGKESLDNGRRIQVKDEFKSNSQDKEEDSLADFKSPKHETARKPILNKYRRRTGKTEKKIAISRTKSRKNDTNQPSIAASLLKPQTYNQDQIHSKEGVPCLVCLKPFKDDATCTGHMKNCAAKNNVSIKQLLEAKRLEDRKAQERRTLGLPAAPIIPEKKATFRKKNYSTGDDPQLQLALAMSESLYEAEKEMELEQVPLLAGIPLECITEMNEEERKKTLQNFGFTTNKPRTEIPTNEPRKKKKKLLVPTVLQTRSKQDKDRVLTERIACILTGEDALTRTPEDTANTNLEREPPKAITSRLLKKIMNRDDKLWDQSTLTKQSHNFYVNELKSHFIKSKEQEVESEIHELPAAEDCEKRNTQTLNILLVYEPTDSDIITNNQGIERNTVNCETFNMNALEGNNFESEFVQNFINSWKGTLNDISASDLIVLVKNNKFIYAHKLVFHVQCPNILLDIEPLEGTFNSPIGQKISWLDIEEDAALAFLEFIYSGTIHKHTSFLYHEESVRQVEELARLYGKQNLCAYIKEEKKRISFERRGSEQLENFSDSQGRGIVKQELNISKETERQVTSKGEHHKLVAEREFDRRITASPDLFDSEEDEANSSRRSSINNSVNGTAIANSNNIKGKRNHVQESEDESDLHMNSQKTLVNLSRSVSPVENIHEAITPPSGQSPRRHGCNLLLGENQSFSEQEIAEAVTPKRQSPEKTLDIVKQEVIESLASAVTPEHMIQLSDFITPKKLVYADMAPNDVIPHIDESIYTAVTPPRHEQEDADRRIIDKTVHKGELTMFIEKVQRRRAKDIMDTDSETDSPRNRVRPKNPFSKRNQDDSYKYLRNDRNEEHHKAISLLEKDVLDEQRAQKHLENVEIHFNENTQNDSTFLKKKDPSTTSKLGQVGPSANTSIHHSGNTRKKISMFHDEVENITLDETEMSMYTEYKKFNQSDRNISFYRKQLGFDTNNETRSRSIAREDWKHSGTSRSKVSQSARIREPRIIEDVTLVSDSDEEENPLRILLRNKRKEEIYRNRRIEDVDNGDLKDIERQPAFNIENDVILDPSEDSNVSSFPVSNESKKKNQVIDLSVDSDDCDIQDESNNSSNNKSKSLVMELQTNIEERKKLERAEKKSEEIDAEINKILESNQELIHFDLKSDQREVDNGGKPSSIFLASSPELCEIVHFNSPRSKNNNDTRDNEFNNYSQNSERSMVMGENGDFDVLAFNDWNVKTPPKETARSMKSPEESSIKTNNSSSSCLNALSNLNGNDNQSTLLSSPTLRQKKRSSEGIQEPSSKLVTRKQNKKFSNEEYRDVTPPLDLNSLDTPNLQKQLKNFGFKPQKKEKARILLTHIYKETHSQLVASQKRNSNTGSSSEEDDDEPPTKRQNVRRVTEKNEFSSRKNCSVLAQEMDFDEPEVASAFQNPVSIKDAFFQLIKTNRQLYNRILTYEPLALETLHSMLKQKKFKCRLENLMDFLDEQCITFQARKNGSERIKK